MGSLFKKKEKAKPAELTPELFQQLCRDGEKADILIGQGQAAKGQELLGTIFQRMMEARAFDEFLLGKLCLSQIMGGIASNNVQMAFAVWTGNLPGAPGKIYAAGIQAVETGVLDVRDTIIYQVVGAFLHACGTDLNSATKGVNTVMSGVMKGASEHLPEHGEAFLGHWKYCLTRVYDDDPAPPNLMSQVEEIGKKMGISVPAAGKMVMLKPSEWKPVGDIVGVVGPK